MAIRNDLLYAESYVDLLVIDISNPEQPGTGPTGSKICLNTLFLPMITIIRWMRLTRIRE